MAFSQDICLTPDEYRFYAGAVIDRQALVKDTTRLNSAISDLRFQNSSLNSDLVKSRDVEAKMYEKGIILEGKVSELENSLDTANIKVVRNRKIAIVGWGIAVVETIAIGMGVYFALH